MLKNNMSLQILKNITYSAKNTIRNMGSTVYENNKKIHFDLRGDHNHKIRIYDFENGEFKEQTIPQIRDNYTEDMQKTFFAEILRYAQGSFTKKDGSIVYKINNIPMGAIFGISDIQKNREGDIKNVNLNTMGSITYDEKRILNIDKDTNKILYEHFLTALNNRIDTGDLF